MKTKPKRLLLASALPMLLCASQALGQAAGDAPAPPPADAPTKVSIQKGPNGRKTYIIKDEIRIEGKIQKPEAFFFYQKSSINYDWQELKKDFIPKILDSVSHAPF
jgi:hypothetical protein